MAIEGNGKIKREALMHFVNVGTNEEPIWEQLGDGIEELTREMNNNVEAKTDITGKTSVNVTKGNQISSFTPFLARKESVFFQKLYEIYTDDKELSDVEFEFLEVSVFDKVAEGTYSAIKQTGAVDLKSYGGGNTGLDLPFDVNYLGRKTKGNFDVAAKKFVEASSV